MRLWLLSCATLLTGCAAGPERVRTQIVRAQVPAVLLTCRDQPDPPSGGSQRDVALFIVDLAEAGDDCRRKLDEVRGLVTPSH